MGLLPEHEPPREGYHPSNEGTARVTGVVQSIRLMYAGTTGLYASVI